MIPLRDENPTENFPYITVSLIVINVTVFIYQLIAGSPFTEYFALKPYNIFHSPTGFDCFTFISSMFLHGSLSHIIGNMLFLWIFGDNVEDTLGKIRYIIFYLICGIAAGLLHTLFNINSKIPTLGASGAISGVLGAYLVLFPTARVLTLVPIFWFIRLIYLPAKVFLIVWFIFQFLYITSPAAGGVAFLAHIGGFAVGYFLIRPLVRYKPPEIINEDDWFDEDEGSWV